MQRAFDGVVRQDMLTRIRIETWPNGTHQMITDLAAVEPILAAAIQTMVRNALKLLDGYAVPRAVTSSLEDLLIAMVLNAIFAVQRGHIELWRDPELEKRLGF
jgi:hypothetical protein